MKGPSRNVAGVVLLAGGAAGAVLGVGLGMEEVVSHDLLGRGFLLSAWIALRDTATAAALWGLLVGALLAVAVPAGRFVATRLRIAGDDDATRAIVAALLAAFLVLAVRISIYGDLERPAGLTLLGLTAVAILLAILARRAPGLAATLGTTALAGVHLAVTGALLQVDDRFYFSGLEVLARNTAFVLAGLSFLLPVRRVLVRGTISKGAVALLTGLVLLPPAVLWAATATAPGPSLSASNPKNVLLVGIDTLRRDHTDLDPARQGARVRTPNLRRLAERGVVFESAVSQSSWTLPAFASMFTGKYPQQHGAMYLSGTLREGELTLPEILREAGYATGAATSHFYLDHRHGFAQGFDYFREYYDPMVQSVVSSERVTDLALEFLEQDRDGPFFLFAHYFDPHYEYVNHAAWTFADGYGGWLLDEPRDIYNLRSKRHLLGSDEVGYLVDLYDEEIAHTDAHIGRLLGYLDERGVLDDTVVVVVSDHGEEFLERGWLGHTITLNEEIVGVPMVVALPGRESGGTLVETPVETRNLFATLLDYLGVDFDGIPGESFLAALRREGPAGGAGVAYTSVWLPQGRADVGKNVLLSSVRRNDWKLIVDHLRGVDFLYDLGSDPGETRDLSGEHPEMHAELQDLLDAWIARMEKEGGDVPILEGDPALQEKLRSLGYL